LVVSPATVSARPLWSEISVLVLGLSIIFALNGLLLASVLRPLDRLTAAMATIDLRRSGGRPETPKSGPARALIVGFNTMLDRLESERATSTSRALKAQEEERQRIAQELHDEVGQSLTAVLLSLKQVINLAPPDVAAELNLARDTTRTSLEEVRRISQRLRPGVLADLGLLNSLSSLASDHTARTGVAVRRGFPPGLPALSVEAELVVYRVTQEALTNVARHARAQMVELGMVRRRDVLELRIADDGVGCGSAPVGAGIQGMAERARMIGGEFDIRPRAGGGTEVVLEIPVDDQ
jgi:two-component system sensor histidine kinase UhpB